MDRTTYAHPDVVALVEGRFVPVRVDGDRRPDLNDRYNLGGWPTTVFLTSAGDVLSGGTYFDASGLMAMLGQVADAYRDRADELAARASSIRRASTIPSVRSVRLPPSHEATADHRSPGEGGQPDRDQLQPDVPIDHFRSLAHRALRSRSRRIRVACEASASLRAALRVVAGRQRRHRSEAHRRADARPYDRALGFNIRRVLPLRRQRRLESSGNGEDARRQRGAPSRLCRSRP